MKGGCVIRPLFLCYNKDMAYDHYKALYIHIPYCKRRCNYCDFHTRARECDCVEISEYIENIVKELRSVSKENKLTNIETVYIGGGTPSHIGSKNLSSLLYALSMFINIDKLQEFSMEANPESLSEELVKDIWALGVNRLSIGVQSFDDDILKMLGRIHDADAAKKAIEIAKTRFKNISIDLMCGIPGQNQDSFESSLKKAIELDVSHVSIYPLQIEANTVFYKWKAQGKIDDIDDDVQADHMLLASEILTDAGFEHYEVASYAKPGFESKHNLSYWFSKPYLGIGESATTMTQNSNRRMRVTDNHVEDDLNSKEMLAEDIVLACRTKYGISNKLANEARSTFSNFDETIEELIHLGLLKTRDDSLVPTEKGWLLGNELYSKLLDLK